MTLLASILAACLLGGLASLLLAGLLAYWLPVGIFGRMVAFAAGTMLAAALLDILPEAFSLAPGQQESLFATVLAALMVFYLLERAALWRHAHADPDDGSSCWCRISAPASTARRRRPTRSFTSLPTSR